MPAGRPGKHDRDMGESLEHVLSGARDGAGGVIVLRGEPGSGKTTLLRRAIEQAPEVRVMRAAGVESEREFNFAALHQLLFPLFTGLDRIPRPQREALGIAFGLTSTSAAPDRFMVGLAVLSLLADAASDRPLMIVIDDAQWLDEATAQVLAFVARRVQPIPVGIALAVREPAPRLRAFDGLPCLRLGAGPHAVAQPIDVPCRDNLVALAWQGRETEARAAAADFGRDLGPAEAAAADHALAILELGLGHYQAALGHALAVYRDGPPDLAVQVIPDLVEAATRCGHPNLAGPAARRLATGQVPLVPGLIVRSRAMLAGEDAEDLYRQAIGHLWNADADLARTRLVYGEWLRRRRRRRDAREQLRAAHELFSAHGFAAFAGRAEVELRATGERVGKRGAGPHDRLTAQEAEVARLVADGHSNRQVAGLLFISENTVQYHLGKIFRKVGVGSRTQLARVMLGQDHAIRPDVAVELGRPA
jgi:DNA-binding CsgD family transcriptional regulator